MSIGFDIQPFINARATAMLETDEVKAAKAAVAADFMSESIKAVQKWEAILNDPKTSEPMKDYIKKLMDKLTKD